jgi:hypothetical protein
VRQGAGASPSGASRPLPRAAGRPACPRRCPGPLPDGPGPAPRRLCDCRGLRGGPAGGGISRPRPRRSRGASLPPGAQDGTARRLVRPQAPAVQTEGESGQTKAHPVKNGLLVQARRPLLLLRDPYGGRGHALRLAAAPPSPVQAGSPYVPARGCPAGTLPPGASRMPTQQPRGQERPLEEQRAHQARPQRRRRLEHVHSRVKRGRSVTDRLRLWKQAVRALVMALCCALQNCRGRLTPPVST